MTASGVVRLVLGATVSELESLETVPPSGDLGVGETLALLVVLVICVLAACGGVEVLCVVCAEGVLVSTGVGGALGVYGWLGSPGIQ
mgnify:CR=1 FL=1